MLRRPKADAMLNLCTRFNDAIEAGTYDPLLLMPVFILDFLCIHPFNDGNGRMSRLLTLLLLYRAGFIVGKYISIEMLIEKSKDSYYEALQTSSQNWHENGNDYLPFLKYMLGIVVKAYNEFEDRVEYLHHRKMSKADRISVSPPLSALWQNLWPVDLSTRLVSGALRPTSRNS